MTEEAAKPPHILTALDGIMNDVTAMGKDGFNSQQKFPFRSHDGVVNLLGPAFRRHKVIPTVTVLNEERRQYQTKTGTAMMETRLEIDYSLKSLVDESTHLVGKGIRGEAADAGDKSQSKALTVAIRQALIHGFVIPTQEPDPDETITEQGETVREVPPEPLTKDQADLMSTVTAQLDDAGRDTLNQWYKANRLPRKENLSEEQADMVLQKMADILKPPVPPPGVDPKTGEYDNPSDPF